MKKYSPDAAASMIYTPSSGMQREGICSSKTAADGQKPGATASPETLA
jgi:hypothetical protein